MSTALESQIAENSTVLPSKVAFPLSAEAKRMFLDALLVTGGNITKAAGIAGCTRQNVLRWRDTDPAFAEEFEETLEYTTENLEEAAYLRALKSSDVLIQFLLKARRPEKYRENIKLDTEMSLTDGSSEKLAAAVVENILKRRENVDSQEVKTLNP